MIPGSVLGLKIFVIKIFKEEATERMQNQRAVVGVSSDNCSNTP